MKKGVRKNQIIVTALAIMIVVAGYLNFTGQEISTSGLVSSQNKEQSAKKESDDKKSEEDDSVETSADSKEEDDTKTDLSAEDEGSDDYTVNEDGEVVASKDNPGEAVMVSNSLSGDYFSSAKLSREQNRAKNKSTLMEIINNKSVASAYKNAAVKYVAAITEES